MAVPIVAIIGRPNVGKSTLFNRIAKTRDAIVDSVEGVTRDRHYARTDWCGSDFILVDTGGYLIHYDNDIDKGIKNHVEEAIHEADVVIFLVDIKSGVTEIDMVVGRMLQKAKKPTILAVNKVDTPNLKSEAGGFMKLGFGEAICISSAHGRKVGDMLDEIVEKFPSRGSIESKEDEIALAIIGKPNVGKSSIVNAIFGKEKMLVTDIAGTTRDAIDTVIKREGQMYRLIDTAGLRRKTKVSEDIEYYSTLRALRSLDRCHVAIIVVDVREGLQSQDMKIIDMAIAAKKGILIVLNKWDLIEKDDFTFKKYEEMATDKLKSSGYINIITTSAVSKQRVFKILDTAKKINTEWHRQIDTNSLNKALHEFLQANRPPSFRGKFITIKYVTQTGIAPPVFTFFVNFPKGVPDNYQRYLLNKMREKFGFDGVPITILFKKK